MATLKIISDKNCRLFIDQDFICEIEAQKLYKHELQEGVYLIDAVSSSEDDNNTVSFDLNIETANQQFLKRINFEDNIPSGGKTSSSFFNNPDVIFCHHPFDTHQAHVGVSKSTISAARRKNTIFMFEPIAPSGRSYVPFKPQMYVDITDVMDKKIESLKMHTTEYHKFGEEWITGVTCRAGFRGYEIGTQYAEAFEVLRCELDFGKRSLL